LSKKCTYSVIDTVTPQVDAGGGRAINHEVPDKKPPNNPIFAENGARSPTRMTFERGVQMKALLSSVAGIALLALTPGLTQTANATSVIQIPESAFVAGSGEITFSEVPLGTQNPVYAPALYGGGAGSPTVTFGGFFGGQSLSANPGVDCPGAAATGCVVGTPTGPLTISGTSPVTFTANDSANPTSPVLSGSPLFNGPVAIEFSTPQTGVGLDGGFFDAIASTGITAYDINGNVLGTVANNQTGIEFLGLVTDDHSALISGLLFHLVGAEPAGFAVDNIRFGVGSQVVNPVPGPIAGAGLPGLIMASGGLLAWARRRRRQKFV
jgi:hypothetical protein